MRTIPTIALILTVLSISAFSQSRRVDFCDLVKDPGSFTQGEIVLSASYHSGFEWSYLVPAGTFCTSDPVWVDFDLKGSCGAPLASAAWRTFVRSKQPSIEGLFRGRFATGGEFGHMGAYPHKFTVSCIESVTLLPREVSGCARVDPTREFHYLEEIGTTTGRMPDYGEGPGRKSREKLAIMRLVNNSTCPIRIPVAGRETELLDGRTYPVLYSFFSAVASRNASTESETAKRVSAVAGTMVRLASGKAVKFFVPMKTLIENFDVGTESLGHCSVSVPFAFDGKTSEPGYEPFCYKLVTIY